MKNTEMCKKGGHIYINIVLGWPNVYKINTFLIAIKWALYYSREDKLGPEHIDLDISKTYH